MTASRRILPAILGFGLCLLAWACAGKGLPNAAKVDATGQHPLNWISSHWQDYARNPDQCSACHGSLKDPAQAGGVSKVSCFTCHPGGATHPGDWRLPLNHGRQGAMGTAANPTGFAACARCHGSNYQGGLVRTTCFDCHLKAPHPDRPWRNASPTEPSHGATDASNAVACFQCHANGANSTVVPTTPAPPGTAPGCFNNTLCHDRTP